MKSLVLFLILGAAAHAATFSERFEAIKHSAKPADLYTFLYALPKGGDLHNHLAGAGRSEWWYEIATDPTRNGGDTFYTRTKFTAPVDTGTPLVLFRNIRQFTYDHLSAAEKNDYVKLTDLAPADKRAWLDGLRLDRPGEGRVEFFSWIWPRLDQLTENLAVVTEILALNLQAFGAEGVRYVETQFGAERYIANDGQTVPAEIAVAFIKARLAQPDVVKTGVTVRFQEVVLRFTPNAEARLEQQYAFVNSHRDLWVGLNMAGIEENGKGYALRFLDKFRELRRIYPTLPLSIHAGEMDGPDHHIRDTLLLGASRIGHGVNLIQDPDTLLLMRNNHFLVEINLISNRLLEYVPDLRTHPFPEYLRTGVPVCLNTDDRGMWDSNMTDEYYTAVTTYNLSWEEVVQLGRNSLTYSFVAADVKARLLSEYEQAVAGFETRFLPGDSLGLLQAVKPVTYSYAKRTWGFEFAP